MQGEESPVVIIERRVYEESLRRQRGLLWRLFFWTCLISVMVGSVVGYFWRDRQVGLEGQRIQEQIQKWSERKR